MNGKKSKVSILFIHFRSFKKWNLIIGAKNSL